MSINRRTAIAVRTIGVASAAAALALGVAGSAFACTIGEFSSSASCVSGHGVITVVDNDTTTPVKITVTHGLTEVGKKSDVKNQTVTFPVDWQPNAPYTVSVVMMSGQNVGEQTFTTPAQACATPTTVPASSPPTAAPTTTPASAPATQSPTPVASGSPTSVAPVVAGTSTNAPSPAAGGSTNLAETGSSSSTPVIAGVAAALVLVGGGSVFALRRRKPAARH